MFFSSAAGDKKIGRGFLVRMRFSSALIVCIALNMPPRRLRDFANGSRVCCSGVSERRRNDVADDNAPLGIAPLGHRKLSIRADGCHTRCDMQKRMLLTFYTPLPALADNHASG